LDRGRIRNVGGDRPGLAADGRRSGLRALGIDVADDDGPPVGGKPRGYRPADSLRRPGHERRLSCKPVGHDDDAPSIAIRMKFQASASMTASAASMPLPIASFWPAAFMAPP